MGAAESICLDRLRIEPEHQHALMILLLAITDRFGASHVSSAAQAQEALGR